MATEAPAAAMNLVRRTEARRQASSAVLDSRLRAKLGQFFTPAPLADFIASLADVSKAGIVRVLDPGAGVGSLTASLVARLLVECPEVKISVTACEVDPQLHPALQATLDDCVNTAKSLNAHVEVNVVPRDFISWATDGDGLLAEPPEPFDLVIMNPPYKKLAARSRERKLVSSVCTETSNLYSAFMALGVHLLRPGGQLLAITPRSFTNGPYFRLFRQYFLERMRLDRVHVFEARNKVFADSAVLQENVILVATRTVSAERGPVVVSTSKSHSDEIWCADNPTHLIHFNGERFLGSYH